MMKRFLWYQIACCSAILVMGMSGSVPAADVKPAKEDPVLKNTVGVGVGYRAPEFEANDIIGQRHVLKEYQGQILVLHFWASWCPYCRAEIPKLKQIKDKLTSKGVKILTVSTDEDVNQLKEFIERSELPYPVIADTMTDPSIVQQYGISGIPVTFVISPSGHIASRLNGSGDVLGAVERAMSQQNATPAAS